MSDVLGQIDVHTFRLCLHCRQTNLSLWKGAVYLYPCNISSVGGWFDGAAVVIVASHQAATGDSRHRDGVSKNVGFPTFRRAPFRGRRK